MNALFSKTSLQILESLSFTDTLYAFDFDGTLAPIVAEPDKAYMTPRTESLLRRLAERVPVAIISGRALDDLRTRINAPVKALVGNHGLEGIPGASPAFRVVGQCQKWKEELAQSLFAEINDPGLVMEDKRYSLALHYRKSRKKQIARRAISGAIAKLDPAPRVIAGKLVFNLVPSGGPHKGVALSRVLEANALKFAFYIGDDDTDEDVFALPDHRIFSVRVGNRRNSSAKYFISKQSEIDSLLMHLLRFHGAEE